MMFTWVSVLANFLQAPRFTGTCFTGAHIYRHPFRWMIIMKIKLYVMGAQYFTSTPMYLYGAPVITFWVPVNRNLFLEFPDNVLTNHNINGQGFPTKGEGSAFDLKIDSRNPREGFILKFFKWENPGEEK